MDFPQSPVEQTEVQNETRAGIPLTSEALIEEVSIDGMCGVY